MLYNQHPDKHLHNYIRQWMRRTSRLLQQLSCNNNYNIVTLDDAIHPNKYDDDVKAVKVSLSCKDNNDILFTVMQ